MALYIHDDGDKLDSEKWDFYEGDIPVYKIGKYPYKAFNRKNALLLSKLRILINKLCVNLEKNRNVWYYSTNNKEYLDGVDIFLGIHKEDFYVPKTLPEPFYSIAKSGKKTSRYLISEIPKGTVFLGIIKPRMKYIDNKAPPVGKDKKERALYRHIFLDLSLSPRTLTKLIIHELAHTMANHVRYRVDDHHADFKWCEKLIAENWPV